VGIMDLVGRGRKKSFALECKKRRGGQLARWNTGEGRAMKNGLMLTGEKKGIEKLGGGAFPFALGGLHHSSIRRKEEPK